MPVGTEEEATTTTSSGGGFEGGRVRFVGKHSKDTCLSLYVQKRNIVEVEGSNDCEALGCIIRIRNDIASTLDSRGQAVIVGVLARLVCDFGLQYTENALYQVETQIYPPLNNTGARVESHKPGGIFDLSTKFVTSLPDEHHVPFLVRLPPGLPPSVQLRSGGMAATSSTHWGLTYYVFAYITSAQAAASTLARYGVDGAWPRLKIGRRHSKVFLSFAKTIVGSVERISRALPPSVGNAKRRSLLAGGTNPLFLEASLDKAAYVSGDPIHVSLRLQNMGRQRVAGIRITVKQLLTVKYGNEPRHVIKTTIAEYEGHERHLRDRLQYDTTVTIDTRYNPGRPNYQLALEARYATATPGTALGPVLAASSSFAGLAWGRGPTFGIDRLRVFTVEYYVNVHAVIPWASNVIVKLPFQLVASNEDAPATELTQIESGGRQLQHGTLMRRRSNNQLVRNLIAFDLEEDHDDFDLDDEGDFKTTRTASADSDKTTPLKNATPKMSDLKAGQAKIENGSAKLRAAHRDALEQNRQLDRRSIALRFANRRIEMTKDFLDQVNMFVAQDLPRLRQGAPSAAQTVAARLISMGAAHAAIVPLSFSGSELIEEHLEVMSRLVDDFELYLARAIQNLDACEAAFGILERMVCTAARLVNALPGYYAMERSLYALRRIIIRNGWAIIRGKGDSVLLQDDHSDDEDLDIAGNEHTFDDREQLLAAMAEQFQSLYAENDGDSFEAFPIEYREYVSRLNGLLSGDLPKAVLGPTAYFHWRFLLALSEHFHLRMVGSAIGRLLFPALRDTLRWNSNVEGNIPARFLLGDKIENELEETANQIVLCMQRLYH